MYETTTPPQKALNIYSQAPWLLICLLFFASPLLGQSCPQPPVPELLEAQQITGAHQGDNLGATIAMNGKLMVVGSPRDSTQLDEAGSAEVYRLVHGTWQLEQQLQALSPLADERFGNSVDVYDDGNGGGLVVISTRPINRGNFPPNEIAVYVYRFDDVYTTSSGPWHLEDSWLFDSAPSNGSPGSAVSVDNNFIAVGVPFGPPLGWGNDDTGHVIVMGYGYGPGGWSPALGGPETDGRTGSRFGSWVDIHNGLLVVGAPNDDNSSSEIDSGKVYVLSGGQTSPPGPISHQWAMLQELDAIDGPATSNKFGASVAISNDVIVVGAHQYPDGSGNAHVFRFDNSTVQFEPEQILVAPDGVPGDIFGRSVAISDDTIVVGAFGDTSPTLPLTPEWGAAYVFQHVLGNQTGSAWTVGRKLAPLNLQQGDRFGVAVAVSGCHIGVGASRDDDNGSNSGSAFVFQSADCNSCVEVQDVVMQANVDEEDPPIDLCIQHVQISLENLSDCMLIGASFDVVYPFGDPVDGPQVPQAFVPFDSPVSNGGNFFLDIPVSETIPGECVCLEITLHADNGSEYEVCCTLTICVEIPEETGCRDCNQNGVHDPIDIANGTSLDLNNNGIPDECIDGIVGDTNGDGQRNIADVVTLLSYLFSGGDLPAAENADFNGDSVTNIADAIALLNFLFGG